MKIPKSRLSRALACAAVCMIAAPAAFLAPAPAALAATKGDVDHAVAALRAIKTMSATFTQVDRNGQQLTGKMILKRPGKIRFEYQKGVPLLIVSDGARLTMLDYEVRQKQVWPIKSSPLGALLDPGRDVARFGTLMPTSHPDIVSVRVRDPDKPEYGTITLIFRKDASSPGGMELESWVSVDAQNSVTKIFLDNHRYGIAVSDGTFTFKDVRPRQKR